MRVSLAERTLSDALLAVNGSPVAEAVLAPCSVCIKAVSDAIGCLVHLCPLHNDGALISSSSRHGVRTGESRRVEHHLCSILIVLRRRLALYNHLSLQLQRRSIHNRSAVCKHLGVRSVRSERLLNGLSIYHLVASIEIHGVVVYSHTTHVRNHDMRRNLVALAHL